MDSTQDLVANYIKKGTAVSMKGDVPIRSDENGANPDHHHPHAHGLGRHELHGVASAVRLGCNTPRLTPLAEQLLGIGITHAEAIRHGLLRPSRLVGRSNCGALKLLLSQALS